jgi:uncharacterized protein
MLHFLVGILVGYISIMVLMFVFQRQVIYQPNRQDAFMNGTYAPLSVLVTTSSAPLPQQHLWHPMGPKNKMVVLFHGNAGNVSDRLFKAKFLIDAGYGVTLAEYRGFGGNSGTPTERGLYADAQSVIETLIHQGVAIENMVLMGESLGTGVAVEMATRFPTIAGLILETPYTSLPDAGAAHYPWLPVHWLMRDKYESLKKIGQLTMPKFIIHGDADETVPFIQAQKLAKAAPQPVQFVVVPKGHHADLWDHGAGQAFVQFLDGLNS